MSKRHKTRYLYFVLAGSFLFITGFVQNINAEQLGRLFLTPEERSRIDKIRFAKPKQEEPVKIVIKDIVTEEPEEPVPDIGGIRVNGLVYRQDGKSTAWINNTNTFEGNLENQYIEVNSGDIKPDNIKLKIYKNETDITLKVGETYETTTDEVTDLTDSYKDQ